MLQKKNMNIPCGVLVIFRNVGLHPSLLLSQSLSFCVLCLSDSPQAAQTSGEAGALEPFIGCVTRDKLLNILVSVCSSVEWGCVIAPTL